MALALRRITPLIAMATLILRRGLLPSSSQYGMPLADYHVITRVSAGTSITPLLDTMLRHYALMLYA